MAKQTDELCPRCFIGRLQKGHATFLAIYNDQLTAVPGAVAYTCDICDFQEFDDPLVEWVASLAGLDLTPETLPPPMNASKMRPPKS